MEFIKSISGSTIRNAICIVAIVVLFAMTLTVSTKLSNLSSDLGWSKGEKFSVAKPMSLTKGLTVDGESTISGVTFSGPNSSGGVIPNSIYLHGALAMYSDPKEGSPTRAQLQVNKWTSGADQSGLRMITCYDDGACTKDQYLGTYWDNTNPNAKQ